MATLACRVQVQSGHAVKTGANKNVAPIFGEIKESWVPVPTLQGYVIITNVTSIKNMIGPTDCVCPEPVAAAEN